MGSLLSVIIGFGLGLATGLAFYVVEKGKGRQRRSLIRVLLLAEEEALPTGELAYQGRIGAEAIVPLIKGLVSDGLLVLSPVYWGGHFFTYAYRLVTPEDVAAEVDGRGGAA